MSVVSDDMVICVVCDKKEADVNKVMECLHCHKCYHYKCKKIIGSAVQKMRNQKFFCSVECNEIGMKTQQAVASENLVIEELRKVMKEVHALREETVETRRSLQDAIKDVERSQEFLCNKFDDVVDEIKQLKLSHNAMGKEINEVRSRYGELNDVVVGLESEVDRFKRAELSRNAILLGVPASKNENVSAIVTKIAAVMGYSLTGKIVEARRLGESKNDGKYPPIRVVFDNESVKEELFAKKRSYGQLKVLSLGDTYATMTGKITLRDEMTSHGLAMLRDVRGMQERLKAKFLWPGRNGVILVKRTETAKLEYIRNRHDVNNLGCSTSKRGRDGSSSPEASLAKR